MLSIQQSTSKEENDLVLGQLCGISKNRIHISLTVHLLLHQRKNYEIDKGILTLFMIGKLILRLSSEITG